MINIGEIMIRTYILLVTVMLLWGFNVSALKVLVTAIDPVLLTAVRIGTAGICVLIITYFLKILRLPTKEEWKTIGLITIFNVILHHSFLALGLEKTSGVNGGLILGTAPLLTILLSVIFLKDRVTRLRALGFLSGFIGILITTLVGTSGISTINIGDAFVFISISSQAISFILISKLNPNFDPRLLTGYMLVIGSIFIFIFNFLFIDRDLSQLNHLFSWHIGLVFLFSAVLCTAFGHMVYNLAITQVGPSETTIFINLNTFFSLLGAAIFLNEPIYANHFIGLAFILFGVVAGTGTLERVLNRNKAI